MPVAFSRTESQITSLFTPNTKFSYKGEDYQTLIAGKPCPPRGECKTDTFILAQDESGGRREFKISVKQTNADFLENKISMERAIQIFGSEKETEDILSKSLKEIQNSFEEDYLVLFRKYRKTGANTMKIGWKFELLNKTSGDKSGELQLTEKQLTDIYAGTNLASEKANSSVGGELISGSGIANFILVADSLKEYTAQEVMNKIEPIQEYIIGKEIFFACKAINYRADKDKWDGDRPLAVFVEWQDKGTYITSSLNLDRPLEIKANQIGQNIRGILQRRNITNSNFNQLKSLLRDTKYLD